VFANSTCSGTNPIATVTPLGNRQFQAIPFEPGIPVAAGGGVSIKAFPSATAAGANVTGYVMPSNAVPAGTQAVQAAKGGSNALRP
jgi:hypothetical protein